jgi:hypothetical protein
MSQKIPLFISEEKLKSFSSVNQNVSPLELVPYILQAQDIELQYFFGSTFYFQLKNQVLSGTVDSNNQFLLDNYVGNALVNYGLARALPFLKYKIYNKSVLSPTSESADTITLQELQFLQEQAKSTAEVYMKRCMEWILLHPGNYPAYFSSKVTDGQMPSYDNPIGGAIVTNNKPYAWRKRLGGNQWVNDGMNCPECFYPNTYVNTTVF